MGQDENSLPSVWRAHVGRSETIPLRIEPERGKVGEYSIESANNERCDVFNEHVAGSKNANDACELRPEAGAGAADADPFPGVGDVLAREASADDFRGGGLRIDVPHVVVDADTRPVTGENHPRKRVALRLPDGWAKAKRFEATFDAADPGK